jgi:exosortase family protein XrtF
MERMVDLLKKVPQVVKTFLLRAALIYIVWQLLYLFVLSPTRVPDKQLTDFTTLPVAKILSLFYHEVCIIYSEQLGTRNDVLTINGKKTIAIGDACNALEIYVLYVSFLFCFPGTLRRRLLFVLAGLPYIYVINVVRVVFITYLNIHHKSLVEISHHYIFTIIVYLLVFYLWVLYSKNTRLLEP